MQEKMDSVLVPEPASPVLTEGESAASASSALTVFTESAASASSVVVQSVTPDSKDEAVVIADAAPVAPSGEQEAAVAHRVTHQATVNSSAIDPPEGRAHQIFPGIGKIFALPSHSACDVDAFVQNDEDSSAFTEETDEENSYPMFVSMTDATDDSNDDAEETLQRKKPSRTPSARVSEAPLDSYTDPFAPRVGKTLLWRNVNMTLVRLLFNLHCQGRF